MKKSMIFKYTAKSPAQTKKLGKTWAKKILKMSFPKKAVLIGLRGDLGGGKTTFLQGFAKGLGVKERVLSPTFVIVRKYQLSTINKQLTTKSYKLEVVSCKSKSYFYHIDCYRIQKPKEILNLGFKKIISDPQNIVAIEWADRIKKIIPKGAVWIDFEFINKNKRKIAIKI